VEKLTTFFILFLVATSAYAQPPSQKLVDEVKAFGLTSNDVPDVSQENWERMDSQVNTWNLRFFARGQFWKHTLDIGFNTELYEDSDNELIAMVLTRPAAIPQEVVMIYGNQKFKRMALRSEDGWHVSSIVLVGYTINGPHLFVLQGISKENPYISIATIMIETEEGMVSRKILLLP